MVLVTAENLPAVRPVGLIDSVDDLARFLDHLHRRWNDDPEVAHSLADEIKTHVLQLVADGHPFARDLAVKVLEIDTWDDVRRWFA